MATGLSAVLNSPRSLTFIRLLKPKICAQKSVQFSSLREPLKYKPVQYSTNKAAKFSIAELLGFSTKEKGNIRWQPFVLVAISSGILIYFCVLRTEENELDELFKTGIGHNEDKRIQLIDLKLKLQYCKSNNLPTDALRAKIDEIEQTIPVKKPFRV